MDTTTLSFQGAGGESLGAHGHSKDHRPDLRQMVLAVVLDGEGRPVCTEMLAGNSADMTVLLPVVDRLRKRFGIGRVCVVADRGMISTADQNLDAQMAALEAAGCTMIRTETGDDASLAGRPELGTILEFIHPGETLVVTRIDRLARSMRDLQVIVATLKDKGAHLAATEQPVDTSTAAGKAFFDMLGVFAEFETNLRRERQAEGIAAAKQRGAYRGRPPRIDMEAIRHRLAMGLSPTQVARELGISRGTVYKAKVGMTDGA